MRKLMVLPGIALGALTLGVSAGGNPVSAASHTAGWNAGSSSTIRQNEDDDEGDDDSDEDSTYRPSGSGSGAGSGSGSELPSTGSDAAPMMTLGAFMLVAGGAMYVVSGRRARPASVRR